VTSYCEQSWQPTGADLRASGMAGIRLEGSWISFCTR
jgi:hypothetical protein